MTFKDECKQSDTHFLLQPSTGGFCDCSGPSTVILLKTLILCLSWRERERQREGKNTFTSNKKVVWIHLLVSERDSQGVRNESSVSSAHLALADYSTWVRSILCPFPTNQRLSQTCHHDCSELQVQVWWHHGCKFSPRSTEHACAAKWKNAWSWNAASFLKKKCSCVTADFTSAHPNDHLPRLGRQWDAEAT